MQGPKCTIKQSNDTAAVEVVGGSNDDLDTVIQAAHSEFTWLTEGMVTVDMVKVVDVEKQK